MTDVAVIKAQSSQVLVEAEVIALGRQKADIPAVVGKGLTNQGRRALALLVLDEHGGVVVDVLDLVGA